MFGPAVASSPFGDATALMNQVDRTLKYFGSDLTSMVNNFDLKSVGIIAIVIVAGIFLFDLIGTGFGAPFLGRSLSSSAAQLWQDRPQISGR